MNELLQQNRWSNFQRTMCTKQTWQHKQFSDLLCVFLTIIAVKLCLTVKPFIKYALVECDPWNQKH